MASATVGPKDVTISNVTIDGNNHNNVLFSNTNYMLYCKDAQSTLIKDVELRNSTGDGLYLDSSSRVSVENSTIVDGCLQDNIPFKPLVATGSTSTRVNDCLFENYPGSVDVSGSSVVSTGGNIIRNCGAGLDAYATGKITTTNNILLGPSDEWLPSPDIYDSDWNSINLNVSITSPQVDFYSPVMLYVEDGIPKDLSPGAVTIVAGIGTLLNVNQPGYQATMANKFVDFEIPTVDVDSNGIDKENGYIGLKLSSTTITDKLTVDDGDGPVAISSHLAYEVVGTEFLDKPVGYTTYVGIATGKWGTDVYGQAVGTSNTCYWVHLKDVNQLPGISVGDVVQLGGNPPHAPIPSVASFKFVVEEKNIKAGVGSMRLAPVKVFSNDKAAFPVYTANIISGGTGRPAASAGTYEVTTHTTEISSTNSGTQSGASGAEFSVFVNVAGEATVTITSCGTGYVNGNIIQLANTQLGNVAGGSDLKLEVANVTTIYNQPTTMVNPDTGLANGQEGGYITIKKTFVIAKGRVGVS